MPFEVWNVFGLLPVSPAVAEPIRIAFPLSLISRAKLSAAEKVYGLINKYNLPLYASF